MRGMRAGQATRISVRVHACDLHALALVNAVVSSSCLDIVLWVPVAVKDNHLPHNARMLESDGYRAAMGSRYVPYLLL